MIWSNLYDLEAIKEQIPLSYPRLLRQRGRGLPCAATLEREKLFTSQTPVFNREATSRPSAGRAHSRTVTAEQQRGTRIKGKEIARSRE